MISLIMRFRLALALLLLGACASGKVPPPAPPPTAPADPGAVPAAFAPHLRDAEEIGRTLYQHDHFSAVGTDVLVDHLGSLEGKGVGGYLTFREGTEAGEPLDSWLVEFFSRDDAPRIRYRVRIAKGKKPQFEAIDPPRAANEGEAVLIRARRTALAHLMRVDPPSQPINPVILPGAALRESGILVYLLAGTKRPGVAVMGKHHRVLLSSDASQVLRFEPLTKSILEIEYGNAKRGDKPAAIVVSHLVTEWPLETHVFASLLYRQPVYVVCPRPYRLWKVDGARIMLLPKSAPSDGPGPEHQAAIPGESSRPPT